MTEVAGLFRGSTGFFFICAKNNEDYVLYKRVVPQNEKGKPAGEVTKGKRVDENSNFKQNPEETFKKGEFYELRLSCYKERPTFLKGAKVLCPKKLNENNYTKTFHKATIVSFEQGKQNFDKNLNQYKVEFDDEKGKIVSVFETLVVPLEKYWNNELMEYEPEIEDELKEEEEDKEEEKHHRHKHHHKKEKSKRKRHHHGKYDESPSVIIIPIIVPLWQPYF